jgi:hypothetical protein
MKHRVDVVLVLMKLVQRHLHNVHGDEIRGHNIMWHLSRLLLMSIRSLYPATHPIIVHQTITQQQETL